MLKEFITLVCEPGTRLVPCDVLSAKWREALRKAEENQKAVDAEPPKGGFVAAASRM